MPESKPYTQGEFTWFELNTRDLAKAKSFYHDLFGWTYGEDPIPGGGTYTTARMDGKDVGGMSQLSDERSPGVPSHWLNYVWVDDVAATVAKAQQLGGTPLTEAMDMPGIGQLAVLRDPHGAVLGVFHGTGHKGAARMDGAPGAFSWLELMTPDQPGAETFYSRLFGWGLGSMPMGDGAKYTLFNVGETGVAGGMAMEGEQWANIPPNWLGYLTVSDIDATVAKAVALGGALRMGPHEAEGVGRFAVLADPTGAVFAAITYVPRA